MAYPSVITSLTNPLATDKLNSPSHSGIETAQNTDITAIETFLGTTNTSVVGSLIYDVRSPDSNGGGHIQTANKGGTGQTSFTKGDILVATSSSVIAKLAVGLDGKAIVANSSMASGLEYQGVATAKNLQDQTNTYASASVVSASVYSITFPNIVSVLSAGQSFAVKFPTTPAGSILALQVSSLVAQRILLPNLANPPVGIIRASMIGIVENDGTNWQLVSIPPVATATVSGLVPTPPNNTTTFLRGDNSFSSVLSQATSYKNGSTSHGGGSATQTITHGLGKTPTSITLFGTGGSGTATTIGGWSWGTWDAGGQGCSYTASASGNWATGQSTTQAIYIEYGTSTRHGIIGNVGATTFDIVWTDVDNGGDAYFTWKCEA